MQFFFTWVSYRQMAHLGGSERGIAARLGRRDERRLGGCIRALALFEKPGLPGVLVNT